MMNKQYMRNVKEIVCTDNIEYAKGSKSQVNNLGVTAFLR